MTEEQRVEIKKALIKCAEENEEKNTFTGYVIVSSVCKAGAERIAELEKENAELKEKLKPENCLKLLAKDGYIKFTSERLTKAKKIIKYLLGFIQKENYKTRWDINIAEAEQFISEVEK